MPRNARATTMIQAVRERWGMAARLDLERPHEQQAGEGDAVLSRTATSSRLAFASPTALVRTIAPTMQ